MATMICTRCECIDHPKTVTKGSIFIEILLWLCFLVPGIIYSIWRLTTRHKACRACGSADLVGTGTVVGRRLIERRRAELENEGI